MAVSFTRQLEEEWKAIGAAASKVMTKAAKAGWKTSVDATPVETGTARAGFNISVSRRSSYIPKRFVKPYPKTPNISVRATIDKRIYFWNNVPYAYYLEHGLGPGLRTAHQMHRRGIERMEAEMQRGFSSIK